MSKLFLTHHLDKVFSHMEKREVIKATQSAINKNEVFKLKQEAVAKERIAQDQSRQERIIQEQATLRVEQERLVLEKLNLKAEQEALKESEEMLMQIKNGILSAKVSIQQKLQTEREQLDKEKAEHEHLVKEHLGSWVIIAEINETPEEISLLGEEVDFT